MSQRMTELQILYNDYIQQCRRVCIEAPYGAGIFSSGKDPRNHPCHTEFYDAVEAMVTQAAQDASTETEQMIRWMLEVPYFYANEDACWYLLAAQTHVKLLISRLTKDEKEQTGVWFSKLVPKRHRLPVQEEILRMLSA